MHTKLRRKGLVAVVILLVAAAGGFVAFRGSGPWGKYVTEEHARRVIVNAFSISSPGYIVDYFNMESANFDIHPRDGIIEIPISPRSAYFRNSFQWHRFTVALRLSSAGTIERPRLEQTLTTDSIAALGDSRRPPKRTSNYLNRLLAQLEDPLVITAVVALRTPQSEEVLDEAWEMWDSRISAVVLGPVGGRGTKLLTWSGGPCGTMGFDCGSAGHLRVNQFQQWVASLNGDDTDALAAFGLSLDSLRSSSMNPLVHGFVVTASPEVIRRLQGDPRVQRVEVTDIGMDWAA